jgi:RNA polymerase sigma-70 factor (ECF subfamily)
LDDARTVYLDGQARDEEALSVEQAKAGDSLVWARWFDDYYNLLFRYAAVRLGDPDEAADVASQVFLEAMRGISRFNYRGRPVLAWLYGIARNLVSARLRAVRRSQNQDHLPETGLDFTDERLKALVLEQAVSRLSDDQRDVITLTCIIGIPAREVAALLGKKQSTVYSLQARAMSNLRKFLSTAAQE